MKTKERLQDELADFLQTLNPDELFQHHRPKMTFKGRRELEQRILGLPEDYYVFLTNAADGYDMFEITLSNFWTMAESAKMFVRSVELELIEKPACENNYVIAQYLSGKIRTGELLRKLGKIDINQLEKAIREQKERNKDGGTAKIVEVMISMGYITNKDVDILLKFKDESKKRFIMGIGLTTLAIDGTDMGEKQHLVNNMQKEMKKLDHENRILKARLRKVLNIQE